VHICVRIARWTEDFTFDLEPGLMLVDALVQHCEPDSFDRDLQTLF
jgi:hypothetical protein